jgi:aryl-phospho-beta-D-glucosidase BglC (GH1 family)
MARLLNNFSNTIINTPQVAYASQATGSGTRVDSFTASNTGNINAAYSVYINDNVNPVKAIIKNKIVVWGENDLGIGLINQVIPPSASLQIETTALDNIYFTVSGQNLA